MTYRVLLPQLVRRALQLAMMVFVVYAALGGPWRNYKLAHNHRRLVTLIQGDLWGTLYGMNEDALSLLGEPYEASFNFLGMPWAAHVFGVNTADPILVMSHALSTRSVPLSLLLGLTLPVGLALVLGKVFCSHLCPARFVFDIAQGLRAGLRRLGVHLPEWRSDSPLAAMSSLGGCWRAWHRALQCGSSSCPTSACPPVSSS
ncbi:MAG: 4Fe-4S binding protein [Candidatus Tectomicrobia bacterium]|nr:4Fe-4S binding protein [Candidatus Tectomicrobia bacterium]